MILQRAAYLIKVKTGFDCGQGWDEPRVLLLSVRILTKAVCNNILEPGTHTSYPGFTTYVIQWIVSVQKHRP